MRIQLTPVHDSFRFFGREPAADYGAGQIASDALVREVARGLAVKPYLSLALVRTSRILASAAMSWTARQRLIVIQAPKVLGCLHQGFLPAIDCNIKVAAFCNLDCSYCYAKPFQPGALMSEDVAGRTVREFLEIVERLFSDVVPRPELAFVWHGGEPSLAGVDFYERRLRQQEPWIEKGFPISNHIQTNATRVDDAWVRLLRHDTFVVSTSVDGPPHVHDRYRYRYDGAGTFNDTMAGISRLRDGGVAVSNIATVTPESLALGLELYDFLRSIGFDSILFNPIAPVPGLANPSLDYAPYTQFLCDLFDRWFAEDDPRVSIGNFKDVLLPLFGFSPQHCENSQCGFPTVAHNGDLYACDAFIGNPGWKLGNVLADGLAPVFFRRFLPFSERATSAKVRTCPLDTACPWFESCWGLCPVGTPCETKIGIREHVDKAVAERLQRAIALFPMLSFRHELERRGIEVCGS